MERNANHLVEQHFGVMPDLEPNRSGQGITEITRRNILDAMALGKVNWSGRLAEDDFLGRIFDLDHLPSNDHRFKTMRRDIWQHRVNNPNDWEDDWAFTDSRLNLLHGSDEIFLRFLCETVHPVVRAEEDDGAQLVAIFKMFGSPLKLVAETHLPVPFGAMRASPLRRFSGVAPCTSKPK